MQEAESRRVREGHEWADRDRTGKRCRDIDLEVIECRLSDMSGVDVIKEIEDFAL